MSILDLDEKSWHLDDRKKTARDLSVIKAYRTVMGQRAVPSDRQYWSLCGQMFNSSTGCPEKDSEFDHITQEGLVKPEQFNGAEQNPAIHQGNSHAYPGVRFHLGDIVQSLRKALSQGSFCPGLIFLDSTNEPKRAVKLLSDVMDVVNYVPGPVLVVCNVVFWCRISNRQFDWKSITQEMDNPKNGFGAAYRHGWSQTRDIYNYATTATAMGTVVLLRKGPALCVPWG